MIRIPIKKRFAPRRGLLAPVKRSVVEQANRKIGRFSTNYAIGKKKARITLRGKKK